MFERFTGEAREVVVRAQDAARALGAERIEPIHLLVSLGADPGRAGTTLRGAGVDREQLWSAAARAGSALDADALSVVGIDLDRVRTAAEAAFGPDALDRARPLARGHLPFAGASKRVLQEALRVASRRRERRIDSGHLLAGVLTTGDPAVSRVLGQLGTDPDALRRRIEGQSDVA